MLDRLPLLLLAIAGLLTLGAPTPSAAHTPQRDDAGTALSIDGDGSTVLALTTNGGGPNDTLDGDIGAQAAIRRASRAWGILGGSAVPGWSLAYSSEPAMQPHSAAFSTDGTVPTTTFAQTDITDDGAGLITATQTLLRDTAVTWDTLGSRTAGVPGRPMIESEMARELGRAYGLDRSMLRASTMGPDAPAGAIYPITPSYDDYIGLRLLYEAAGTVAAQTGTIEGQVTLDDMSAAAFVSVVAVDVETGRPTLGVLTDATGAYQMTGLPPGRYRLLVTPIDTNLVTSTFYSTAATGFLGGWIGVAGGTWDAPQEFEVTRGTVLQNADVELAASGADPHEPNETTAEATAEVSGSTDALAAFGSVESAADVDVYAVTAADGDVLRIGLTAWSAGSSLDPQITILAADGTTVLASPDVLDAAYDADADDSDGIGFDADGRNLDPMLAAFTVPAGAGPTIYIRVAAFGSTAGLTAWYGLFVDRLDADPGVSASATTFVLDPPYLAAGSADTSTARVTLRNRYGRPVTTIAGTVSIDDGNGPMMLAEASPGVYEGTINAEATATQTSYTAVADGITLADEGLLDHAGPLDTSASTVLASTADVDDALLTDATGRIGAPAMQGQATTLFGDGASQCRIEVRLRDASGRRLPSAGQMVALAADIGTVDASPTFDVARGAWVATFTAPDSSMIMGGDQDLTATITATINGTDTVTGTITIEPVPTEQTSTGGGGGGGGGDDCRYDPSGSGNLPWWPVALLLLGIGLRRRR